MSAVIEAALHLATVLVICAWCRDLEARLTRLEKPWT